jgi:hypothetical protein
MFGLPSGIISLVTAAMKLFAAVARFLSDRQLLDAGQAKGRAESERAHARAAREAGDEMQKIADKPAGRDQTLKRLDEGSA